MAMEIPRRTRGRDQSQDRKNQPAPLRMLDRIARLTMTKVGRRSEHMAVTLLHGSLRFSVNSGVQGLNNSQLIEILKTLPGDPAPQEAMGDAPPPQEATGEAPPPQETMGNASAGAVDNPKGLKDDTPESKRIRDDQRILHDLMSGDYTKRHEESQAALTAIRQALLNKDPAACDFSAEGTVHGEMILLGDILAALRESPPPQAISWDVGGVKLACLACAWGYKAFNETFGRRYNCTVNYSGTHGLLYPGWQMPDWADLSARARILTSLESFKRQSIAKLEETEKGQKRVRYYESATFDGDTLTLEGKNLASVGEDHRHNREEPLDSGDEDERGPHDPR